MSTRQPYDFQAAAAERARAQAEAERRRLELARLQAQRATAIHGETLALARDYERLAGARLGQQSRALQSQQAELSALAERARASGIRLDALQQHVEASRQELERARAELSLQMERLGALESAAREQEEVLRATLAEARGTLDQVDRLKTGGIDALSALAGEITAGRELAAVQADLDGRIRDLEAQVRFVTQSAQLTPIAMVTLQAMESNGYRLRDAIGREELVLYFQREGEAHQIAVRMASITGAGEGTQRWDLLAETFDLKGETCLGELDDFETAVAESGLGRLLRKGDRVYPKDDSRSVLPKPRRIGAWMKSKVEAVQKRLA